MIRIDYAHDRRTWGVYNLSLWKLPNLAITMLSEWDVSHENYDD